MSFEDLPVLSVRRSVVSDSLWPHGLHQPAMDFSRQEHWSGEPCCIFDINRVAALAPGGSTNVPVHLQLHTGGPSQDEKSPRSAGLVGPSPWSVGLVGPSPWSRPCSNSVILAFPHRLYLPSRELAATAFPEAG